MAAQPARTRRRLAWAGTAVVLGGGINLLQHGLGAVHLRAPVLTLITGLIIVVTTLVSVLQERHNRRESLEELEESLDAMLTCWPPRSASRLTAYDVGVHPGLADVGDSPPYVERDPDPEIDAALRETGVAVIFGPAECGKSRSAFEAVRRVAPDAAMVIPTNADGLGKLMEQARTLPLFEEPAVLWLDGLERFAEKLDVDPIDALVHREPRPRWMRPAAEPERVIVVATIRSDELERLLGDTADASHELRRFLAHARGIALTGKLSGNERRRFVEKYGDEPQGHSVAEAFPRRWREGWEKAAPREPLREPRGFTVPAWPAVLAVTFGVLVGLLVRDVNAGGWTEPPDLKTQVHQLADKVRPCQRLEAYPKDVNGLGDGVLVAVVHGGDCPMSDEVRLYRQKSKRLKQISALVPADASPRQTFSCIGQGKADPCHVRLVGRSSVIAGAFMNPDTAEEVPFVVSFAGDEGLRLSPLSPPIGRAVARLRLRVGNVAPPAQRCQASNGCLRAHPATATALLAPGGSHPAALLAGYVAGGPREAPTLLNVRAWRINVPADGVPKVQRRRDCLVITGGTFPSPLVVRTKPSVGLRTTLFAAVTPKGSQLMC
jgi:hypothetical protein